MYIRDRVLDHLHLAEEWMLETYQSEIDILSEIDFGIISWHTCFVVCLQIDIYCGY